MKRVPDRVKVMRTFLHPKNWIYGIAYLLLRLVATLPYPLLMALGTLFGVLAYHVARERRKVIRINVDLCFPELSEKEKTSFVRRNLIFTVTTLFETTLAFWAPDRKLRHLGELHGLHHLEDALGAGRGAIVLSAHFTMLDLGLRLLNMNVREPVHFMYKRQKNPALEAIIDGGRRRHCGRTFAKRDLGGVFRSLEENHAVYFLPDQNFAYHHVFAPFFGILTATVTGTSRIARESGAPVIPFFVHRKGDRRGYRLELLPPLEGFPSGDEEVDAARVNGLIEKAVREHPEQYLWAHRRFKTRPEGEPRLYPQRKKQRRKRSAGGAGRRRE